MANKRVAKKVIRRIGKGLWVCGKGLYHGTRWVILEIKKHDAKVAREERAQQDHDAQTYHDAVIAARAKADVRAQEEARRRNERNSRRGLQKIGNKMLDVPKVNDDYLNQDPFAQKRQKRKS
jgi:hypothetical protein